MSFSCLQDVFWNYLQSFVWKHFYEEMGKIDLGSVATVQFYYMPYMQLRVWSFLKLKWFVNKVNLRERNIVINLCLLSGQHDSSTVGQFGDSIFDSNTDCNTLHDLETAVPPGEGNELLINQRSLLVVQKKLLYIMWNCFSWNSIPFIYDNSTWSQFCLSFVRNGIKNLFLNWKVVNTPQFSKIHRYG